MPIPKALHANMFLVRRAKEVMDTDVLVLPAETSFDAFLATPESTGRMRHVVVTHGQPDLRRAARQHRRCAEALDGARTGVTLGDVASRNFTVVREDDIVFDVIQPHVARRR